MKVILCEDNTKQRRDLYNTINNYIQFHEPNIEIVLSATRPEEIITYLTQHKADCYFLDIELDSDIDGLDLAQIIREKDPLANIIFVTTFADKLKLTFTYKIAALDFILKESDQFKENIIATLKIAYEQYNKIHFNEDNSYFTVKIGEYVKKVLLNDIFYFETSLSPHKVILRERHGYYEFYGNLKNIQEELDERFFRCHRSCIINLEYVEKISSAKKQVLLKNGTECTVSFQHLKTLKKKFLEI